MKIPICNFWLTALIVPYLVKFQGWGTGWQVPEFVFEQQWKESWHTNRGGNHYFFHWASFVCSMEYCLGLFLNQKEHFFAMFYKFTNITSSLIVINFCPLKSPFFIWAACKDWILFSVQLWKWVVRKVVSSIKTRSSSWKMTKRLYLSTAKKIVKLQMFKISIFGIWLEQIFKLFGNPHCM